MIDLQAETRHVAGLYTNPDHSPFASWSMPQRPNSCNTSTDQPSLVPAVVLFGLFGFSGISIKLWRDSISDALAVAIISSTLGFTILFAALFLLSYFETTTAMAGGKTAPKPQSRTVRFRSVVAVVLILSALAFAWQNMSFRLFSPDPAPPFENQPIYTVPSKGSSFIDKVTSPLGQMAVAAVALGILIMSTGTMSKPKKDKGTHKKRS